MSRRGCEGWRVGAGRGSEKKEERVRTFDIFFRRFWFWELAFACEDTHATGWIFYFVRFMAASSFHSVLQRTRVAFICLRLITRLEKHILGTL